MDVALAQTCAESTVSVGAPICPDGAPASVGMKPAVPRRESADGFDVNVRKSLRGAFSEVGIHALLSQTSTAPACCSY